MRPSRGMRRGALPVGFIATDGGCYRGTVLSLDLSRRMAELTAIRNRKLMDAREELARANEANPTSWPT